MEGSENVNFHCNLEWHAGNEKLHVFKIFLSLLNSFDFFRAEIFLKIVYILYCI